MVAILQSRRDSDCQMWLLVLMNLFYNMSGEIKLLKLPLHFPKANELKHRGNFKPAGIEAYCKYQTMNVIYRCGCCVQSTWPAMTGSSLWLWNITPGIISDYRTNLTDCEASTKLTSFCSQHFQCIFFDKIIMVYSLMPPTYHLVSTKPLPNLAYYKMESDKQSSVEIWNKVIIIN